MKHIISIGLLMAALGLSGISLASENEQGMNHSKMEEGSAMQMQTHNASGVVNKIDMQHDTINLTHGPIKSLGWSGMTMDFMVKETALLKSVKPGQRVSFEVMKEESGSYYISSITPLK